MRHWITSFLLWTGSVSSNAVAGAAQGCQPGQESQFPPMPPGSENTMILRIETDAGIEGIGPCAFGPGP